MKQKIKPPKEAEEQSMLFNWADWKSYKYPELQLMYHVPNGGSRNKIEAARLKAQGVKPGVPDICLPVARSGYHGLYIELKRQEGGRVSDNQMVMLQNLADQGYAVSVCKGWKAASKVIKDYLEGEYAYQ